MQIHKGVAQMKHSKFHRIALLPLALVFLMAGVSHATFVQIYDDSWDGPGDTTDFYWEYSVDMDGVLGGDTFDFSVDFELYQAGAIYQYRYQIMNENDATDSPLQTMDIDFAGAILGSGVETLGGGEILIGGPAVSGNTISVGFSWSDYLPEDSKSQIFWVNSNELPELNSIFAEGKSTPLQTSGSIPAPSGGSPIPEPATMFLFGTGLIGLAGIGRKRNSKPKR